jgi:hypothetical protein
MPAGDAIYGFNKDDTIELLNLIGNGDVEFPEASGNAIGCSLVMKSPGGGIAARSGTTVSSGTCTVWNRSGSTMSAGTQTYSVYNLSTAAVAATVFIVAEWTNIGWVAVWEDC